MQWRVKILDLGGIAFFAIALAVVTWRCWSLRRPAEDPHDPVHTAFCDFQDVVYYPTKAALAGFNPYDARPAEEGGVYFSRFPAGNSFPVYAPLIFVFSLPFALLPLTAAEVLYWIANVGLLLGFSFLLLRVAELPRRPGLAAGIAALMLLSRPGQASFYFGAITLPMTLAALGAWLFAKRQPWVAAVCLAISCIKPTFGGPLFVLLILRRNYRVALTGLATALVTNVAVMALFLPQELTSTHTMELLSANQAVTDSDPAVDPLKSASRIDSLMVAERLSGRHWPGYARLGLTFLILTVAGWSLRRLEYAPSADDQRKQSVSAGLAALTIGICIYHNIYDALLAAVPALVTWHSIKGQHATGGNLALPIFACTAVPALNYFSSKQFLALAEQYLPSIAPIVSQKGVWTLLCVLNGLSLMIAWCLLIVLANRRVRVQPLVTSR